MSYILDALRKADAQRQRDPARGIHAQPLGAASVAPQARNVRGVRLWSAAAVGVVALSSAGWYLYRGPAQAASPRQDPAQVAAPEVKLAQAEPAAVVGNPTLPAVTTSAPPPAQAINPPPVPGERPAVPTPDPRVSSQPMRRGMPQPTATAPGTPGFPVTPPAGMPGATPQLTPPGSPMTARTPGAQSAAPGVPGIAVPPRPAISAPVAPPPPTPPVAGLPSDAPKLVLSGGVYSTNPAQRMLIVNGQVFNEGSEVAPGVRLEEIKARTVVLGFRGARYTVAY